MRIKNAILLLILSAFCMLAVVRLFTGCTTTKFIDVEKEKLVMDSTSIRQRDSLVNLIVELKDFHIKEIQQLFDGLVIFDNECDTVIVDEKCNLDSALKVVRSLKNKVKILSDGSIEAEGNIKAARSQAEKTDREAHEVEVKYQRQLKVSDSLAVELEKERTSKSKVKDVKRKTGGFLVWALSALAFIAGCFVEYKFKIVSRIKSIISKLK